MVLLDEEIGGEGDATIEFEDTSDPISEDSGDNVNELEVTRGLELDTVAETEAGLVSTDELVNSAEVRVLLTIGNGAVLVAIKVPLMIVSCSVGLDVLRAILGVAGPFTDSVRGTDVTVLQD